LKKREEEINNALEKAQRTHKEMEQLQADNEIIMAKAREDRDKMLLEARQKYDQFIEDAKINAKNNQIDNTLFYAGDMKNILTKEFVQEHGRPDVIITDPPRDGMHPDVIETILSAEPKRIVYVSCNPATQARDLNLLDVKYKVTAVQPVDMFPHTHHVENVVALELK
jgi:uncharacterized protein YaiL (DUF2058 family)